MPLLQRIRESIGRLPDRLSHSRRFREATMRLMRLPRPRNILVVCHGNVCRSPYLEVALGRLLPDVEVSSAGFAGGGHPVPAFALEIASQKGLDLTTFRSRALAPTLVRDADMIVVMDERQYAHLCGFFGVPRARVFVAGDLDPRNVGARTIRDPWQQSRDVFAETFDRLDRVARSIAKRLRRY